MKMSEEFTVAESPVALWEFFEQVDRVAWCVPGVEEVTVLDADNSRLRVTQSVGPMVATFDVKMRITARDPGRSMEFTVVGRSVSGAAGNVRATNTVRLEDAGEGTHVRIDGDVALGGMLGSVGQKVMAKQASKVAQSFAEALQRELSGGSSDAAAPAEPEPASAAGVGPEIAQVPEGVLERAGTARTASIAVLVGMAIAAALILVRRFRSSSR